MQITTTIFKSKIAQKIATLVIICTIIPLALVSWLSIKNNNQLINEYEDHALVDQSKNFGLNTFDKLLIAKNILMFLSKNPDQSIIEISKDNSDKFNIFTSIVHITNDGKILSQHNISPIKEDLIKIIKLNFKKLKGDASKLYISPNEISNGKSSILLIKPIIKNQQIQSFLIGAINSTFIWGDPTDYPENINICAYKVRDNVRYQIFCSNDTKASNLNNEYKTGYWDLFLKGEFDNNSWRFITSSTSTQEDSNSFINKKDYIIVILISFLLAGLLGLNRTRKMMRPLEDLTDAAKLISKGDYTPVVVDATSEFTELAQAFNQMSHGINEKIKTLKTLSTIDSEIASNLNVEDVIDQVIARMQKLSPTYSVYFFRIEEKTDTDLHCNVTMSSRETIASRRITIPIHEIEDIESYNNGHFTNLKEISKSIYKNLLAEFNGQYFWILPIQWQKLTYGFMIVGNRRKLNQQEQVWQEYRDLTRRISIAISSHERESTLIRQSQHDILTGLPNRILLEDRLNRAIEHSNRTHNPVWVIFLDLDRFKYINDSLGHHVGDQVLLSIAKTLKENIRDIDTVARFGGDEFVIILNCETSDNINTEVLNRILNSIETPIEIMGQKIITTCSLGVSVYPNDSRVVDELIRYADIAMYRAKDQGKNNFQFFTQEMNQKAESQLRTYTLLRQAIMRDELSLLYQPKIDISSKKIIGAEALLRWHSEELGTVSPLDFIPLAEETGLIIEIGEWVMRTACTQAVCWQKANLGNILMSVNVSARQMEKGNFLETTNKILAETGLKAEFLDIELTESLLFGQTAAIAETFDDIRKAGISISIDDFGTGFSNLAQLNNLSINTLKIDKSFIDSIDKNTLKAPIVDTIILLAKSLNLNVVAEGVELLEQAEYLSIRGCNQIQGYYFSKPVRAEIIAGMLSPANKI
jgi:diguanylate cyclase (GGDEF)-like protein